MLRIYHNPRCSKSRQTLALLQEHGHHPEIVDYIENPPSPQELRGILDLLGMEPGDILRRKEAREEGIADMAGDALIAAMCAHPRCIERPIVVYGTKAALGRPPENVLGIF